MKTKIMYMEYKSHGSHDDRGETRIGRVIETQA